MTRDDIICMAREAGMEQDGDNFFSPLHEEIDVHISDLERFAALVAAAERERLAQPKQEPVAWLYRDYYNTLKLAQTEPPPPLAFPVYTTPPRREWVGLTEEEAFACRGRDYFETYRAIEAKLKEKNA